jgi:hypothetical protein
MVNRPRHRSKHSRLGIVNINESFPRHIKLSPRKDNDEHDKIMSLINSVISGEYLESAFCDRVFVTLFNHTIHYKPEYHIFD